MIQDERMGQTASNTPENRSSPSVPLFHHMLHISELFGRRKAVPEFNACPGCKADDPILGKV
jgi:hypothetical protein